MLMTMRFLFVPLVAFALFITSCGEEGPPEPTEQEPVSVETATATAAASAEIRRYRGTVRGLRRVPLSTKMMGTVERLPVEEGDRVQTGQTLARIRSQNVQAQRSQVQARLREARAALDNAETNFERMKALRKKESATQKEFDDAQTAYERAQAQVEALEGKLEETDDMLTYATIESPINGAVVQKPAEAGGLATPGRPLLVVETLDALKAVVQVREQAINRFATGDSVTVKIGAAGDRVQPGVVTQINPGGNPASRQFEVQVRLPDANPSADGGLKSGMYAEVVHRTGTASTLTVPASALVERGQLTGLYAVKGGRALLRWVRTGAPRGDRVEVLSGLRPGETYVADAAPRIVDGQSVQVK